MKAIQIRSFANAADLAPREVEEAPLAGGEVRVRVEAAGVNPSDVKNFEGRMKQTRLPRVLGRDFSGVVVEGPPEWLGRAVWGSGGDLGFTRDGSFAQRLAVPAKALIERPECWSAERAAAVAVPALTAWESLKRLCADWRGRTLLVVGGTGSVGSCAALLAERRGARVWRTRRGAGAEEEGWLNLGAGALAELARKATDGKGMDFVFNTVGGETFQPALAALAKRGAMAAISSVGSPQVSFNLIDFYHQELTLVGVDTLALDACVSADSLREIVGDLAAPNFAPFPIQAFPFERAQDAFQYKGKAVLLPQA